MIQHYPELPIAIPVFTVLVIVEPISLAIKLAQANKDDHLLTGIGLDANEIVQSFCEDQNHHSCNCTSVD